MNVNVTQTEDVLSGTPPSTITFNAKQTTVTLTVATDDDNADEVASEVTAQVQVGTGYTVGTPSSATVTVNDNDIPQDDDHSESCQASPKARLPHLQSQRTPHRQHQ